MDTRPMNPRGGMIGIVHVHSDYSHDGRDTLETLYQFARDRRIGFVGMTDHAEDFDRDRFEQYRAHCLRLSDATVKIIPGLEFRFGGFPGLHLLALGLSEWIEPATPADFIRFTRDTAEFTIVAHPILPMYQIPPDVLAGIDAIEVWNAAYNTRYFPDPRAIRLLHQARQSRAAVVGTAGLDQHDSRNDRETRVILSEDTDNPLASLKAGRFSNRGRTMGFDSVVSWSPLRLTALAAARWMFDRFERIQERGARWLSTRKAQ
jgi:hypothetical protein